MYSFVNNIEKNLHFLFLLNKSAPLRLLLAVSGGADSISMLYALNELQNRLPITIIVVTINHNLREQTETAGDAQFVRDTCKKLRVPCVVCTVRRGAITEYAKQHHCGVEAAARRFRYKALSHQRKKQNCKFILTAHNRNDFYETVLMRLFQGGNPESLAGLKPKNGCIVRPLLNISRKQIEAFLNEKQVPYRTDSTNSDTRFLRNRVRSTLMPALNNTFPQWQKSLQKTLYKIDRDCTYIDESIPYSSVSVINQDEVRIYGALFARSPYPIRRRLLQKAFDLLGLHRLSFTFVKACCELEQGGKCQIGKCSVRFSGDVFVRRGTGHFKQERQGLAVFVTECGTYSLPIGTVTVSAGGNQHVNVSLDSTTYGVFQLPFIIRSAVPGDMLVEKSGKKQSVQKLINNKPSSNRELTAFVIERLGTVAAVITKA